MEFASGKLSGA